MARMIPAVIYSGCASPGEHEIFRNLKDDPRTKEWIVLHSLDIAKHNKQVSGEADFVIIVPYKGVLCCEVKAHTRVRRDVNGQWHLGNKSESRGPFKQASGAMHSIRKGLVENRLDLEKVLFWSAVIFPYSEFSTKSPEWHDWQVIDKIQYRARPLSESIEQVLDNANAFLSSHPHSGKWFNPNLSRPTLQQCELIVSLLRPSFEFIESSKSQAVRIGEELKHYTSEQFDALDAMENNPRVSFVGLAGTGKTLLAIEAARRARAAGRRVLFLCFNHLLKNWLVGQTADLQPQVVTRTLHAHMLQVLGSNPSNISKAGRSFWNDELPLMATERLLETEGEDNVFDELIIDEAQDVLFNEVYLDFLELSLKGGWQSGRWLLFGDYEKQALYSAAHLSPEGMFSKRYANPPFFTPYRLRKNCRNPPRIAEAARLLGALNPGYSKILRPDNGIGPKVVVYKDKADQLEKLAMVLASLYEEGLKGQDIAVVSRRADNECAASQLLSSPWKERLKTLTSSNKGQIPYCSIHAFKGLEALAVVLTDIESITTPEDIDLFYVGVTRAVNTLVFLVHEHVREEIITALS